MAVTLTDPADAFVLHNRASSSRPLAATADDAGAEIGFVKSRRDAISFIVAGTAALPFLPTAAYADAAAVQDSLDVENFLRKGVDLGGNMGVSSQAGKSRPQTGVVLRDGTEVRQAKDGSVAAEILTGTKEKPVAVMTSFSSPWKLETGPVFDVECRDKRSGDGIFVAVTENTGGKRIGDLPNSFFLDRLFSPTGRFSFYGPPTDIKVKKSTMDGTNKVIELSFSNLSQSTNAEIPRNAMLVATIPEGTDSAVMLIGSANAARWKNGASKTVKDSLDSFKALPSPKTNLKLRAKDRSEMFINF